MGEENRPHPQWLLLLEMILLTLRQIIPAHPDDSKEYGGD